MSVTGLLKTSVKTVNPGNSNRKNSPYEIIPRLIPEEGLLVLLLMTVMGLTLAWSVRQGNWVDTPGLFGVVIAALLAGLLLGKSRLVYPLALLLGIFLGFVMVTWQATRLAEADSLVAQVQEIWHRVAVWWHAATSGGISIDLMPFSLIMLAVGWLLAFASSWSLFRHHNIWGAIIPPAIAILTNLSYMPTDVRSSTPFFFFMMAALLLVIRMNTFRASSKKNGQPIDYSEARGWATMNNALWFSILVVALTAYLPIRAVVAPPLRDVWNQIRSPAGQLEGNFSRLMSGVPSKKPKSFRIFGESLPFQGKLVLSNDTALVVRSNYPSHWAVRTYAVYTPQGWLSADLKSLEVGGEKKVPPPPQDSTGRVRVTQEVHIGLNTKQVISGGNLADVNRSAEVKTLAPKTFSINFRDAGKNTDFPADISALAQALKSRVDSLQATQILRTSSPTPNYELEVSKLLPEDLVLQSIQTGSDGNPGTVTLSRKDPILPDVAYSAFSDAIMPGEIYTMVSSVSLASEADLRSAGTEYPTSITDYYLQLPNSLPAKVKELANQLTKNANNPYDKSLAVQKHLHTLKFDMKISQPPFNSDGVTHFLFESKAGYGDYFASAMAVMLRTVGVPARVAAGYSPGAYNAEDGTFTVKDKDSEVWTQVYFPDYGWIDFEPSPNKPAPRRELMVSDDPLTGSGVGGLDPEEQLEPGLGEDELGNINDLFVSESAGTSIPWIRIFTSFGYAILGMGVLALLTWFAWNRSLAAVPSAERAYVKMSRLAALAVAPRKPYQTPSEYAEAIGRQFPEEKGEVSSIALAFTHSRYGKRSLTEDELTPVETAWFKIRKKLAWGIIRKAFLLIRG